MPGALGVAENGRGTGHEMTPSGAPLPSSHEPLLRELAAIDVDSPSGVGTHVRLRIPTDQTGDASAHGRG